LIYALLIYANFEQNLGIEQGLGIILFVICLHQNLSLTLPPSLLLMHTRTRAHTHTHTLTYMLTLQRGVTSTARHTALSHSFNYISKT